MPPEEDAKELDLEGALVENPTHEPQQKAPPGDEDGDNEDGRWTVIGDWERQRLGDDNN